MKKNIYINLSTKDVSRARDFYNAIGLQMAPQFSEDEAVSFVLSENTFLMILKEGMFKDFTTKEIADSEKTTESIICFSAESKSEVDAIVAKALSAGGKASNPKLEQVGMYGWSFQDPDGHLWEVIYMDVMG